MSDLLGSQGNHSRPFFDRFISLGPTMTYAPEDTQFLRLLHWKADLSGIDLRRDEESRGNRDHVLAMRINKRADDIFEKMALCDIPIDEWDAAPVVNGLECITMVLIILDLTMRTFPCAGLVPDAGL